MPNTYSLLIVDDEEWIRRGLRAKVAKSDLPFATLREAGSSEEAWKLIDEEIPDVVLCDIRMAGGDGLDLCERISRGFPEVRLIVVTGFDEFDYARRALKAGAMDYLLKPVESFNLYQSLRRSLAHIDSSRAAARSVTHARSISRRARLGRLMDSTENLTEEVVCEHLADYRSGESLFRAISIGRGRGKPQGTMETVEAVIAGQSLWKEGQNFLCYERRDGEVVVALCLRSAASPEPEASVEPVVEELAAAARSSGGGQTTIGVSRLGRSLERCIEEAHRHMQHGVLVGGERAITAEAVGSWNGGYAIDPDLIGVLRDAVAAKKPARVRELLADIQRELLAARASLKSAANLFAHLELVASEQTVGESDSAAFAPTELSSFASLEEAFAYLAGLFASAIDSRSEPPRHSHGELIYAVKEHIDAHFAEALSLKELAARRHMNPSYLSELFHETIGMTFQDYLMRTRVDHAKLLLSAGSCRMSEVAERSGFSDHTYFSKVFRRLEGTSPKEFFERHRRQHG